MTSSRNRPALGCALPDIETLVAALDWNAIAAALDDRGYATTGTLLEAEQCATLANSYDNDGRFRSRIVMARHGFGRGEYKYFDYPLPEP